MIFWIFSYFVSHSLGIPMMKITGLSQLFKWENLHNWWLTKYFFAPLYIYLFLIYLVPRYLLILILFKQCDFFYFYFSIFLHQGPCLQTFLFIFANKCSSFHNCLFLILNGFFVLYSLYLNFKLFVILYKAYNLVYLFLFFYKSPMFYVVFCCCLNIISSK